MSDEALQQTIAALQAEVQTLSGRVDALSAALEQVHTQREATLRRQLRCPACGGRRALHAREVLDRTDGTSHRMAITSVGFWSPQPRGLFECYVCLSCGFVEWYVKEPQEVAPDDDTLRHVEADEDAAGPYR